MGRDTDTKDYVKTYYGQTIICPYQINALVDIGIISRSHNCKLKVLNLARFPQIFHNTDNLLGSLDFGGKDPQKRELEYSHLCIIFGGLCLLVGGGGLGGWLRGKGLGVLLLAGSTH